MNLYELFSARGWLCAAIADVSDFIWTYLLIAALICCGLYFTFRTRFVQFRMVGEMFRLLGRSGSRHDGRHHISSFQAFAMSLGSAVGTGNLAGVATAITIGGPGAIFWMWIIALIGSATAFVESSLAQLFKRHSPDGFIGGPAYYILHGLRSRRMSALFAVLITITFGLSYNSIQSNTICSAMNEAFGMSNTLVGALLAVLATIIAFGGIKRVARVCSLMVPFMAIGYLLITVLVLALNYHRIPAMFALIVENAFGFEQASGGALGMAVLAGVKRGLFSNEAGEGSAPNVAATASVSHPVKQGLIQSLAVFTDTLVVCTCTAFIILLSGLYDTTSLNGIALTQSALNHHIGSAGTFVIAVAIFFFAFSSIIANYYYGESNMRFLTSRKWPLNVFRVMSATVMVMFGAVASLDIVWNIGDVCMALLTICNLVALGGLCRYSFAMLADYRRQRCEGVAEPVFRGDTFPELKEIIVWK